MRPIVAVVPAILLLSACGVSAPVRHQAVARPSATAASSSVADLQACAAFTEATTGGAPAGQNPLTWLSAQDQEASPKLSVDISEYVLAKTAESGGMGNPHKEAATAQALARTIENICDQG
jgi:hypothetical protein